MENTISLPTPIYKDNMTEFAKEPLVEKKKSKKKDFDKLLDKVFLDKYFRTSNLSNK